MLEVSGHDRSGCEKHLSASAHHGCGAGCFFQSGVDKPLPFILYPVFWSSVINKRRQTRYEKKATTNELRLMRDKEGNNNTQGYHHRFAHKSTLLSKALTSATSLLLIYCQAGSGTHPGEVDVVPNATFVRFAPPKMRLRGMHSSLIPSHFASEPSSEASVTAPSVKG